MVFASKWDNIPEDTEYVKGLVGTDAAVCKLYGCTAKTTITCIFDPDGSKNIVQHGPNPEHVMIYYYPKDGYLSLDEDAIRTQDQLPDNLISIDDWLVRIHNPERIYTDEHD